MKEVLLLMIIVMILISGIYISIKVSEMLDQATERQTIKQERIAFLAGMDYQNRRIRQFDCVPDSILMPPLTEVIDSNLVR